MNQRDQRAARISLERHAGNLADLFSSRSLWWGLPRGQDARDLTFLRPRESTGTPPPAAAESPPDTRQAEGPSRSGISGAFSFPREKRLPGATGRDVGPAKEPTKPGIQEPGASSASHRGAKAGEVMHPWSTGRTSGLSLSALVPLASLIHRSLPTVGGRARKQQGETTT